MCHDVPIIYLHHSVHQGAGHADMLGIASVLRADVGGSIPSDAQSHEDNGSLAQRESVSFTPRMSAVQSRHDPPVTERLGERSGSIPV